MDKKLELRQKFCSSFSKLMKHMPPALQKTWNNSIEWDDRKSSPIIAPEVIQGLTPGAKAAYVMLLNNLSRDFKKIP